MLFLFYQKINLNFLIINDKNLILGKNIRGIIKLANFVDLYDSSMIFATYNIYHKDW